MKAASFLGMMCAVLGVSLCLNVSAQPLLSVDINIRSNDPSGLTMSGFQSFQINSNVPGAFSGSSIRTFGAYTVRLTSVGNSHDDRQRATPVNGPAFSQSQLLRDFVFSRDTSSGGLDVTIDGLSPDQSYLVTVWSFDSGSTAGGVRYSDWSYNGVVVTNAYGFSGANSPTSDGQYQFTFPTVASASGQILIQGRRNGTTAANQVAVFLNAFQISSVAIIPPTITQQPTDSEEYEGDAVILAVAASGTQPFSYQWFKDDVQVSGATSVAYVITNLSLGDVGRYSIIVSNASGSATSALAQVSMRPVESVFTGLISYWPLDEISSVSPDMTTNQNHLFPHNMDASYLVPGKYSNAVSFNPESTMPSFLSLELTNAPSLPIYRYPAHTVALWVNGNASALTQNDRRVYAEASTNTTTPLWSIGTDSAAAPTGVVDIYVRNDGGGVPLNHKKSSLIAFDGNWHHIAWVDNNGFGAIYVDGVKDTNDFTYVRNPLTANTVALGIIHRATFITPFTGLIDDVAVWRRALRAEEVQLMMTNSMPSPRIVAIALAEGSVTLTYTITLPNVNPRVEELAQIGGTWSQVGGVTFSPYTETTSRAQFAAPQGSQRFYRLTY